MALSDAKIKFILQKTGMKDMDQMNQMAHELVQDEDHSPLSFNDEEEKLIADLAMLLVQPLLYEDWWGHEFTKIQNEFKHDPKNKKFGEERLHAIYGAAYSLSFKYAKWARQKLKQGKPESS